MTEPDLDRAFAEFAATGDPARLAHVYDALAPELLRVAIHIRGDAAEAEDVLQATFVTAIERADQFERGRAVKPWLLGILAHHARAAARRARRTPDPERTTVPQDRSPIEHAGETELFERLDQVLLDLPEAFRPVLVLRLKHGLTAPEIAEALARPPGTVRSQLARGIEALRRSMPATLTGFLALADVRPVRGLESIREAVMSTAAQHAPVAAVLVPVAGAVLVKKLAVVVAVLVVAWLGWSVVNNGAAERAPLTAVQPGGAASLAATPREGDQGSKEAAQLGSIPRDDRSAVTPVPAVAVATTSRIEIAAVFARDRKPARGQVVIARFEGARLPYFDEHSATTDESGHAVFESVPPGLVHARMIQGGDASGLAVAGKTLALSIEQPAGLFVQGEVVDTDGIGVRNAAIWSSEHGSPGHGQVVATTNAAGRFELQDVGRDRYVAAMAPGRALSSLQALRGAPGDTVHVTIVLEKQGNEVRGRVLDQEGRPVAHALVLAGDEKIRFDHTDADGLSMPDGAPVRTLTDAEGRYRVEGVPVGNVVVQARAPGFGTARVQVAVSRSGADQDIVLAPEAIVSGTVRDAKDAPLRSVEIRCGGHDEFATSRTWSDESGAFFLCGLRAGTNDVIAQRFDLPQVESRIELAAGERRTWDPRLVAQADPGWSRIHGTLHDERGATLSAWNISADREGGFGETKINTTSDLVGRFNLRVRENERYRLLVRGPDEWAQFPRAVRTGIAAGSDEVDIVVVLDAPDTATITGTVTTSAGDPASDAQIIVWHAAQKLWLQVPVERKSGRFEIVRVPPGTVKLDVRSPTLPWLSLPERTVEPGARIDLGTIRMPDAGRVTGTISGARDESLATVELSLADANQQMAGQIVRRGRDWSSSALAPGKYTLFARGPGIVDVQTAVEITAGRDTSVSLTLRDAEARSVRVENGPTGADASWVTVAVLTADGTSACMRSSKPGADGIAHMTVAVEPGTWRLLAMAADGRRAETTFVHAIGDAGEISVRLPQ